jgi:hypothetical protein
MGKSIRWLLLGDAGLDAVKIINFEIPTDLLNAPCDVCAEMQMSGTETVGRRPMGALGARLCVDGARGGRLFGVILKPKWEKATRGAVLCCARDSNMLVLGVRH